MDNGKCRRATEILKYGYDMHVHAAPDGFERTVDYIQAAKEAGEIGMRGIVFKDHHFPTVAAAALVQKVVPQVRCYGSMTISGATGGFNAAAVEKACQRGAKIIWFPTLETEHFLTVCSGDSNTSHLFRKNGAQKLLYVLDDRGRVKKEVEEILEVIRDFDAVCSVGHLSKAESWEVVCRAVDMGIRKLKFSHPQGSLGLKKEEQVEFAEKGVYMSYTFLNCIDGDNLLPVGELVQMICAVGPEKAILSSDGGQLSVPKPRDLMVRSCAVLLESGVPEETLKAMVRYNPAYLLGDQ